MSLGEKLQKYFFNFQDTLEFTESMGINPFYT